MLTENEVERVRDLQCFLVTINGDHIDAEVLDESRVIRGHRRPRTSSSPIVFVLLVCSTQGACGETLWGLNSTQDRAVEITVENLNGWQVLAEFGSGIDPNLPSVCVCPTCLHATDGVGHGQDGNDRLGTGTDSRDHTTEDIGRCQSTCGIVDQHNVCVT